MNPRYPEEYTSSPNWRIRPLSHPSDAILGDGMREFNHGYRNRTEKEQEAPRTASLSPEVTPSSLFLRYPEWAQSSLRSLRAGAPVEVETKLADRSPFVKF